MFTSRIARMLITVAFAVSIAAPAAAMIPPPAPAPVATFDVGSLHVQQYGSGPKSLIFIPGLTCGPWEWSGQIAHFASTYTVYALTLPGFDGQPPIDGPLFQTTSADFWKLLDQQHIVKPIVIGHSLGGTMGFLLATQHADRLAGVIALDGLPIYPTNVFLTPAKIKASAISIETMMAKQTPAQFENSEQNFVLPYLMTAPADVAVAAPLTAKSDPAASGKWFYEDLMLDLRPQLAQANVPILLIAPYDVTLDGKYLPSMAAKQTWYAGIIKNAPDASVVMIDKSRHFAMYDQPQAVTDDITQFLAKLP
jgi:pimeloyl-ACP methyl ester carboxylesterase